MAPYVRPTWLLVALPMLLTGAASGPRAVVVSVDGLRPDVMTPERAPRLAGLRAAGVSAARAVNDLPSVTMTNHATMLTGLRADRHHVLLDVELPGQIASPTIFDTLRDAGLRGAFLASKGKLRYLARDELVETVAIVSDTAALTDQALGLLAPDGPDFIFLHLRDPDSVGHAHGWLSPMYDEAVAHVDVQIGRIADALSADPSRASFLVVTADHGGQGTNHFLNVPENRLIPWLAVGPGIPPGGVLAGEVSTADTMPTVLSLLGVAAPPGLDGRVLPVTDPAAESQVAGPIASLGLPCMLVATPGAWAIWRMVVALEHRRAVRAGSRP